MKLFLLEDDDAIGMGLSINKIKDDNIIEALKEDAV